MKLRLLTLIMSPLCRLLVSDNYTCFTGVYMKNILFILLFLFVNSAVAISISPPAIHFENGEKEKRITITNSSLKPIAIYVYTENYDEASEVDFIMSSPSFLLPAGSTEVIFIRMIGKPRNDIETLSYIKILELLETREEQEGVSTVGLNIESTLKITHTPEGINMDDSRLILHKNGFKNTGPRYVQMLSYKCRDETVIKSPLLFEPYNSAVVEQELCDVISYLESEYGVVKEIMLD